MLRALLEKWAASGDVALQDELEGTFVLKHPRCHEARPGEPDAWCVVHGGFWHGWRVNPDRPADHAHILAATIEAIEAKGGQWVLRGGPGNWVAGVDAEPNTEYWQARAGSSQSPAEALLTSYLAALEAES